MEYCPPNVKLGEMWVDHGVSQCLMDTVTSVVIATFLLIFGIIQIVIYKRYPYNVVPDLRPSKLYFVQLLFTFFTPVMAVLRFILQAYVYTGDIYSYMIVVLIVNLIVYPLSGYMIIIERRQRPSALNQGHGFALLVFWSMIFISENLSLININKDGWWWHLRNVQDQLEMSLFVCRYFFCMVLFVLGIKAPGMTHRYQNLESNESNVGNSSQEDNRDDNRSIFRNIFSKLRALLPYLWPKSPVLQLHVSICILSLIAGRVINLFVPIYSKKIVDSLTETPLYFRWDMVIIFGVFKLLQGTGADEIGLLNDFHFAMWIKVQQYINRELQLDLFRHLHSLPLQWHLSRKTGEILRVLDRGTSSIENLLDFFLFSIIPTIVDITVAVVFFVTVFNVWFGLIVFSTMVLYIVATIVVTEWRIKFYRRSNDASDELEACAVDSLLNYDTVKYFSAEQYELTAYSDAMLRYQKEEFKSSITINLLNTIQNTTICIGLLSGSLLAVSMIINSDQLTTGDYVLFASYIIQLFQPLNWFGTYYRIIQKNFVDMESMMELLGAVPEEDESRSNEVIVDGKEHAVDDEEHIVLDEEDSNSALRFRHVSFSYEPDKLVLKDINFKIPSGATVALVGPSGSGKSTIARLIFRLYEATEGAVEVGGCDARNMPRAVLRSLLAIVPQEAALFSNTVRFNIQYGRLDATEDEVISAAKNADIHETIMKLPDGYDTQVGERGLRLSGGERERIAIARAILKDPTILILDEATSALDTNTERNIQVDLARVCANRTTLIIAHRLSTITHADEILVLKDGEIIERGSHESLLTQAGLFASMWKKQIENKNINNKTEIG